MRKRCNIDYLGEVMKGDMKVCHLTPRLFKNRRVSYLIMSSNPKIYIFIIYKSGWHAQHNISILFINRGISPILLRHIYLKIEE